MACSSSNRPLYAYVLFVCCIHRFINLRETYSGLNFKSLIGRYYSVSNLTMYVFYNPIYHTLDDQSNIHTKYIIIDFVLPRQRSYSVCDCCARLRSRVRYPVRTKYFVWSAFCFVIWLFPINNTYKKKVIISVV